MNDSVDLVRHFQANGLRKSATFMPPMVIRRGVLPLVRSRGVPPLVRSRRVLPPSSGWLHEAPVPELPAPQIRRGMSKWIKYGVPAAAGTAVAAGTTAALVGGEEDPKERIKQLLYAYAPYVGGGAAIGALLGGGIGYANDNTLLGTLGGTITGAGLAAAGKYAYDKYKAQA